MILYHGTLDRYAYSIADGNVTAYFETEVTDITEIILNNISPKKNMPFQISFHTEKALTALELLEYNIIKGVSI